MARSTEKMALLVLRYGLGLFLLIWGIDKFINPEGTVKIFSIFYKTGIGVQSAYIIGMLEIFLSLAILAGLWKTYSYGIGLLVHAISTLSSWKQMMPGMETFNHLFVAALPVLAAFIALWLLRDKDTLWTL